MQSRGSNDKSYRKRPINCIDRGTIKCLPFPLVSVSAILCVIIVLSATSAIYIGVAGRRKHSASAIQTKDVSVKFSAETKVSASHERSDEKHINGGHGPSIRSLQDLSPSELHPKAGPRRHIVDPPSDAMPVTLVTCTTTVGYLHVSDSSRRKNRS